MNRYPLDRYDRVWDADEDFSPSHLSVPLYTKFSLNASLATEGAAYGCFANRQTAREKKIVDI